MSRLDKTLADYVAIAISPALIMALVGSLVFFLLGIFYQGEHEERVRLILALFVFAAVLIGRISIEEGKERAALFAAALGIAMFMAIQRFANTNPLLSCGLIALVWWCSDKLVWDCTLIDETEDSSGEGLLRTAGLEERAAEPPEAQEARQSARKKSPAPDNALAAWWQRMRRRRRRAHSPGVWVVYFSLAALPLFGFGQVMIPAEDVERRRHAFDLLVIYVASGLGLLVTTSFLGLRRYLRQRGLQMPKPMAGVWIAVGAVLIVSLMLVAMLIPRPNAEYAISQSPIAITSSPQESSRYSPGGEGADKNRPDSRSTVTKQDGRGEPGTASQGKGQPDGRSGSQGKGKSDAQGSSGDQSGGGKSSAGQSGGKQQGGKQSDNQAGSRQSRKSADGGQQQSGSRSEQSSDARSQDSSGRSSPDRPRAERGPDQPESRQGKHEQPEQSREQASDRARNGKPPESREKQASTNSANQESREAESEKAEDQSSTAENPSSPHLPFSLELTGGLSGIFKVVLYAVAAVVIAYWLWKSRAQLREALAELRQGWSAFWQWLFGRRRKGLEAVAVEQLPQGPVYRPFADFPNPFTTGRAGRFSPEALVKYTFEAFEAWSRERGLPRQPDETPYELARMVGLRVDALAEDSRQMVDLYCRVAYAAEGPTEASVDLLERFWRRLGEA